MQTINRFKSHPSAATSCRELLKKQRADSLLGAWRRQRGNPLYLAVRGLETPDVPTPLAWVQTWLGGYCWRDVQSLQRPCTRSADEQPVRPRLQCKLTGSGLTA